MVLEILPPHTHLAFRAMQALRGHLTDAETFSRHVDEVQRPEGYRLLGAFDDDRGDGVDAVAVLGFRFTTSLAWGRFCYVDDLSTLPEERGKGHATALLERVHEIAADEGAGMVHLDSGVQPERAAAHGLYFSQRYRIASYHFSRTV
ncbi:GNAT family N-acetyltransferase [Myceligenerans pegani]|uniref:GNAT family N-acetyltransferase n=1 Tax=Myceligenerans pegani TaxID=2776917 RepID=A0ABR9MVB7_9MICO|nr:GNAT family N-acetyltransferase [Myceligenerans sp. TRM 65318]MBE1875325.1 GNAT family N-acetyltransferase [Myceligenerans sp. TRM 65318]MBE3017596.1 GNAT family N-acetyltransferase [Myceligenerans sp. TRM 65318]